MGRTASAWDKRYTTELVDRPMVNRRWGLPGRWKHVIRLLEQTLKPDREGKLRAVAVPLFGVSPKTVRNSLRRAANNLGLSFRSFVEDDCLKCWVEEMPSAYLERNTEEGPP